jgi:hypothetical protein
MIDEKKMLLRKELYELKESYANIEISLQIYDSKLNKMILKLSSSK